MNEILIDSWKKFESYVHSSISKSMHAPLYRGQRNADWKLETTLERYLASPRFPTGEYSRLILSASTVIETVLGKSPKYSEVIKNPIIPEHWSVPKDYALMAFLRQNGFPSPLLDWSRSPYVAAFFAFRSAEVSEKLSVSIFEYIEDGGGGKMSSGDEPAIHSLGRWISTDKKHFLQQSEYTVCRELNRKAQQCDYVSHDTVFNRTGTLLDQDIVNKLVIPSSIKAEFTRRLQLMNITAYSLFETSDALMEVLANDLLAKSQSSLNRYGHDRYMVVNGQLVERDPSDFK